MNKVEIFAMESWEAYIENAMRESGGFEFYSTLPTWDPVEGRDQEEIRKYLVGPDIRAMEMEAEGDPEKAAAFKVAVEIFKEAWRVVDATRWFRDNLSSYKWDLFPMTEEEADEDDLHFVMEEREITADNIAERNYESSPAGVVWGGVSEIISAIERLEGKAELQRWPAAAKEAAKALQKVRGAAALISEFEKKVREYEEDKAEEVNEKIRARLAMKSNA